MTSQGFLGTELLACGSWRAFERALLRLVIHQGFEWARLTAGAGDRGSDIIGYFRGHYWTLQAKFSLNRTVPGPSVITKELASAIAEYRTTQAILATNASLRDGTQLSRTASEYSLQTGTPIHLMGRERLLAEMARLPEWPAPRSSRPLHAYQQLALGEIFTAMQTRTGPQAGALVAMATGTGKSRVMNEFIASYLQSNPDAEVLVLVESVPLAQQLERTSWEVLPKHITTHLWAGGDVPAYSCPSGVTFATTDSIVPNLGVLVRPGRFKLLIVDEAHHAAADTTRRLISDLKPEFKLGLTATPWRGDNRSVEQVFGGFPPVYRLSVVDAIRQGYLANVDYTIYGDHIDWDRVAALTRQGLRISDLNRTLWIPERENTVAKLVRERIDSMSTSGVVPRTIMFCRTIPHATAARVALNAAGVTASELHSELSKYDRTRVLQKFRDGELRVVTVVDMLNEGIDVPDIELMVFNRVTHSRRIFLQQLGRGLRKTPQKDKLTVLDFVADIRRLAELQGMDRDYAEGPKTDETLDLPSHLVAFSEQSVAKFVDEYLKDVGDIAATADDSLLLFP